MKELYLIIHNVRSAHNVGSLFRSADGAGVSKIYVTGYTPAPVDRFGRKVSRVSKVSLGAEDAVPWEKVGGAPELTLELIQELKKSGVQIVSLEQHPAAVPYMGLRPRFPVALIVGNEIEGIEKEILEASDVIIEIPMRGEKESLNVANAGSVALFHINNSPNQ